MSLDIVGDIRGEANALKRLLKAMGYFPRTGVYRNSRRRVVFVGNFINGSCNIEVVAIIKAMVENGAAIALMGNQEFNAICFHTVGDDGQFRRKRTNENIIEHMQFLQEHFSLDDEGERLHETIEWFKTLPVFFEDDGLRAVHACWDFRATEGLRVGSNSNHSLIPSTLAKAMYKHTEENSALSSLIQGVDVILPKGEMHREASGKTRRTKPLEWWKNAQQENRETINMKGPILKYPSHEKPLFFGHYRLKGNPAPLSHNMACLDYSLGKKRGNLCAYRWDGETRLDARKLVSVAVTLLTN